MRKQLSCVRRLPLTCAVVFCVACTPSGFPDDPLEADRPDLDYPVIAPLAPILELADPDLPDAENPDPELSARGDTLRASAQAGAAPVADEAQLTARGDALRQRAAEIRATEP
ncbi:MAG: hypothetical protein AAGH83_09365 [Pseudomonadota bacterium]